VVKEWEEGGRGRGMGRRRAGQGDGKKAGLVKERGRRWAL